METYRADEKLTQVLINQGFIVTYFDEEDRIKDKKVFKRSKQSRKYIKFNYVNIEILNSGSGMDNCYEMNEHELKLLLLWFFLKPTDRKNLMRFNHFSFKTYDENLSMIKDELEGLKKFDVNHVRQKKIERIIKTYNSINI